ncbi:MAG: hypothetical protein EZS28_021900 [Streblomastix strix]|uniref:Uncharacterized protein n=1 Tax=Streblomastix strix TaxID=222440 RepID=A0A5J4VJF9_9EUKA|nr:MAG: hypothetical protein EZS28_021900 [Streblomastix strix]
MSPLGGIIQIQYYALFSSWVEKFSSPGLIRSAAIGFTNKTLGAQPNILDKIIAGVRAYLAGVWRVSVQVIGMSDAQFAAIYVCSVCIIVDSNVFLRNSGVKLADRRTNVQRTKANRSHQCQSHANKLCTFTKVSLGQKSRITVSKIGAAGLCIRSAAK